MFIDEVEIYVRAGKGGDGAVAFRREKYIPNGGPNGGDGGRGGDVIFVADDRAHGLSAFTRQKNFFAENGENGKGNNMAGHNAPDLIFMVPPGTQVYEKGNLIADIVKSGDQLIIAKGGKGGWGNQHFASSIKQAPKWAKEGMKGESHKLRLELKTIADVGLVGLPNAGKSTLLSVLTSARPKIANYPFTTLEPNLGTYVDRDCRFVIADIPGLIEGAAAGRGLGDKFLKHIERTKVILVLLDAASPDILADYKTIKNELKLFSKTLTEKPEIIVLNKAELISPEEAKAKTKLFKKLKPIVISAATNQGIKELVEILKQSCC